MTPKIQITLPMNTGLEGGVEIVKNTIRALCETYHAGRIETANLLTAVGEGVANIYYHAYPKCGDHMFSVTVTINTLSCQVEIKDTGKGIRNVLKAQEPLYTTKPKSGHSGMGFTVMQQYTDYLSVESGKDGGTTVFMRKVFKGV